MEKWPGGGIPFGYRNDPLKKALVVDKDERLIIEKIFYLYKNGYGPNLIANELNKEKLLGRRTKVWAATTISYILTPERLKFYRGFDSNGLLGEWEALLNEEDYRAVLEKRGKTIKTMPKEDVPPKEKYLLSGIGILYCQYCGGRVKSSVTGKNEAKKKYYYCGTRQVSGKSSCTSSKLIPQDLIDRGISQSLDENFPLFLSPKAVEIFRAYQYSMQKHFKEIIINSTENFNLSADENLEKALNDYLLSVDKIKELNNIFSSVSVPVLDQDMSLQEKILACIDFIIMGNESLLIGYKFPLSYSLEFVEELYFGQIKDL